MRKKSVATKLVMFQSNIRPDPNVVPQLPKINDSATDESDQYIENFHLDAPQFCTDSTGNTVLPDGTPVVQPSGVDDSRGCVVQFDLQDGAPTRKSVCNARFLSGNLDSVKCTACSLRVSPFSSAIHPHLGVVICKRCLKFYSKGEFMKDADGKDENCRWCGDGGDLICCDSCSNAFCKSCIKRNIGRTFLHNIEKLGDNELWNCMVCNPAPLIPLQQEGAEIFERVKALNDQAKARADKLNVQKHNKTATPIVTTSCSKIDVLGKTPVAYPSPPLISPVTTMIPPTHRTPPPVVIPTSLTQPPIPPLKIHLPKQQSFSNPSTIECHQTNYTIDAILAQISGINATNIKPLMRYLRCCLDTFSNDIKRVEVYLDKAKTPKEVESVVRSFQSTFRFHLLERLAVVVSRFNEDRIEGHRRHLVSARSGGIGITTPPSTCPKITDMIDLTNDIDIGLSEPSSHNGHDSEMTATTTNKRKRPESCNSMSSVVSNTSSSSTVSIGPSRKRACYDAVTPGDFIRSPAKQVASKEGASVKISHGDYLSSPITCDPLELNAPEPVASNPTVSFPLEENSSTDPKTLSRCSKETNPRNLHVFDMFASETKPA